jgi:hypothetical protein
MANPAFLWQGYVNTSSSPDNRKIALLIVIDELELCSDSENVEDALLLESWWSDHA